MDIQKSHHFMGAEGRLRSSSKNICWDIYLKILFIMMLVSPFGSIGQIKFEKGYYIDNTGQKVECFIKDKGWGRNPSAITYKLSETDESKKLDINEINEFYVSGIKFKRFTVNVDQSSSDLTKISTVIEPIFSEETLLLRALVEGNANLFADYDDRFYYYKDDSKIEQLINKEYRSSSDYNTILLNKGYIGQLLHDLKCNGITFQDIQNVDYAKKDLTNIFIKYNVCVNPDLALSDSVINSPQKKDFFNLTIKPGVRYASLEYEYTDRIHQYYNHEIDYGSSVTFSFGVDAEFIFPFNKRKWRVFLEPTFQYFNAEDPTDYPVAPSYGTEANYKNIDVPFGIKYYFFLTQNSKLFISGAMVLINFPLNSTIRHLSIRPGPYAKFGIGYTYRNKFSIELKYDTERNLFPPWIYTKAFYQSSSFVIGYSIF